MSRTTRMSRSTRMHMVLTFVWVGLAVPVVVWWSHSILVVLLISIYANVVGHWSAYQASRAEKSQQQIDEALGPDGPA